SRYCEPPCMWSMWPPARRGTGRGAIRCRGSRSTTCGRRSTRCRVWSRAGVRMRRPNCFGTSTSTTASGRARVSGRCMIATWSTGIPPDENAAPDRRGISHFQSSPLLPAAAVVEPSRAAAQAEAQMGAQAEQALRRWKWTARLALALAAFLAAALVVSVTRQLWSAVPADERLIGTWQSDVDRTIAAARQQRPVDEQQEAAFRRLFGKLRITYATTTYTTELDGVTRSGRYEVLGRDKLSVVVREVEPNSSPLEVTEFAVLHFDGPDLFWVYTKVGGTREYFRRVR